MRPVSRSTQIQDSTISGPETWISILPLESSRYPMSHFSSSFPAGASSEMAQNQSALVNYATLLLKWLLEKKKKTKRKGKERKVELIL